MFEQRDSPFLHWIDYSFLDVDVIAEAVGEFPPPDDPRWHTFRAHHENGKGQHTGPFGPATELILRRLVSSTHVGELEDLTGVAPLEADLLGGGCHQTDIGGHLDVHVDFNQHPNGRWRRALNLLVYLNDWQPGDGGELELWDGKACSVVIPPRGGTAVLFPTSDSTWHGHPNRTRITRRSLAVYYFTPGDVGRVHSTEWLDMGGGG